MSIRWKFYIHAEVIITYESFMQEMCDGFFCLDVNQSEEEFIHGLIKPMFDMDDAYEREKISDIVKLSFCFSDAENPRKMNKKESEQFWGLPVMKAFLERGGKYYFDDEQRDDVETSIKELLDCWKEEIV
jgi:hypothetical protein